MSNISAGDPTRFPNGISTDQDVDLFGSYGLPDVTKFTTLLDDFNDQFVTGSNGWTVTNVGTGTELLVDADGGVLELTNSAADDDSTAVQRTNESFLFESGKKLFFKTKFKLDDATQSDLVAGLQISDTTPGSVTDGVFFFKDDGATSLQFSVIKDSTSTINTNIGTLVDDTFIELGFFYDGDSTIKVFVDNSFVANVVTTNLPDDEVLAPSFFVQNGEAVAKKMSLDFYFVSKER